MEGTIVANGTVKEIISNEKSITGDYLSGKKFIAIPKKDDQQKMEDLLKLVVQVETI